MGASRVVDHKHSPADVNAGAALGLLCGATAYLLNFHRWVGGGAERTESGPPGREETLRGP